MSAHALSDAPAGQPSPGPAAAALLQRHWDGQLPVEPARIAAALGIEVIARGGPEEPGYPYSGFFEYRDGRPVIEVNRGDSPVRRRFTIAHELGHYALGHRQAPRDYPANFTTGVQDDDERRANQFAAELLMPAERIRALVQSGRVGSLDEMARGFKVSGAAMGYRLKNLGYLA